MKTKILKCIISFIFLLIIYSSNVNAVTNEIIEDVNNEVIEQITENNVEEINLDITEENEISEEILIPTMSNQIVETNLQSDYQGTMNLESPTYNQNFTRPDDAKIKIQGWAVSNDAQATLRILIDGNVVANNIARSKRDDVDSIISPSYGGVENTPNAGFYSEVDTSTLSSGKHMIKVEEISRYGGILTSYEIQINIENKKFQGTMNVETPTYNKSFTRPDNAKIEIQGWAVSNDAKAMLKILVDENIVVNNVNRTKRADVDSIISPSYGGATNTPNAGFYSEIDTNALSSGQHMIKVEEISRYGEILTSYEMQINIENKKYQGTMNVETPTYNKNFTRPDDMKLKIEGWAVSNDEEAILRILVDGNIVESNVSRKQRRDVDSIISPSYGGVENTLNAGFCSELDISNFEKGSYVVKVEELSRYGELITSYEVQINILNKKYQGTMNVETPTYNKSFTRPDDAKIKIEGWAVSNDAEATLRILVDGNIVENNISRNKREDVDSIISPSYGGVKNTPNAGFCSELDISNLDKGAHIIKVEEISRYGDYIIGYETQINIVNKKYQGTMNVETPIYNQNFTRPDDTKLKIEGWAVSNDSQAVLRVLVDGNVVANNIVRHKRADVDSIISPSYGGIGNTPNAGLKSEIDISSLGGGSHIVRIEEISRYGELVSAWDVQIQVKNKQYSGEMVIDTPQNGVSYEKGSNMAVDGWAVAQDENATIQIYIDNTLKATADRYYREDVVSYMNKYGNKTVNAGFGKLINTSDLSVGSHTLTVYEKSRYGDIIGGVQVKFYIKSTTSNTSNSNNATNSSTNEISTVNNNSTIKTSGSKGIDVSQHQGTINWTSVANSGIKFAMIRIGYRGYGTGGLAEDTKFKTNLKNAVNSGLKVGVYYYSTAINTTEAKKDAEYVISILKKYGYQNQVSMPIALDLELVSGVATRDANVSKSMRTNIANTFCQAISNYGYTPMVYACKSFLNDNMNASQVPYDIWVAQYNSKCTYTGKYTMWQYTSTGKVSGINGNVDCNICYINY